MRKVYHKIIFLISITIITTVLWYAGLEVLYARVVASSANMVLTVSGRDSHIKVEEENGVDLFRVYTVINGRSAHYPQKFETLLLPAVMIIAWQLFVSFFLNRKQLLISAALNLGLFLFIHIIFLMLLTAYYTSGFAKLMYDAMMDSFYIIALILIIIDYIRQPVFKKGVSLVWLQKQD